MKTIAKIWVLIAFTGIMASCGSGGNEQMSKSDLTEKIDSLEATIYSETISIPERRKYAVRIVDLYSEYAVRFPEDTISPEYLFKAGENAKGTEDYTKAIELFDILLTEYPDHRRSPVSLFLKADIYEQGIGDKGKAIQLYQEFLDKYPNHYFADGARFSIQNIDKPLEEIIREFEKNQAGDSTNVSS